MDRRSFLRRAAVMSSFVLAGGAAASCGGGPAPTETKGTPLTTTGETGRAGPPDWTELAGSLSGTLLRPGDPGYAAAGHLYNALYRPTPAAVAQCASASDVQRCLAFVRRHDVELAVRAGGHSYAAYSSGPGLVVDVSPLHEVGGLEAAVRQAGSQGSGVVTVGAGSTLIDVYSQLGDQGLLLPGGSCPTVGIAGLALGGGIGVFARAYGLTCDQMTSVDIVTADGVLRRCAPGHDEDLYWACRGGGGGNFGVVTSFDFRVRQIPPAITLFTLEWSWGAAVAVLDAWLRWIPSAPAALWANCQLYSSGVAGNGLVKVTGVFAGTVPACTAALNPLTSAIGEATTDRFVGPEDYLTATLIEAGCEGESVAQCGSPVQSPFAAKSTYLSGPLPGQSVDGIISALGTLPSSLAGAGGGIVFDAYGGAINEIGPSDTAFVHRTAVACAQYLITYPTTSPSPAAEAAASAWLDDLHGLLSPVSQGSYQNYIDPTLATWQDAYYGSNLSRLRHVKRKYDPEDLFHFAQSIPPS
jgi:FAD/FMN-containing dehydrogenase